MTFRRTGALTLLILPLVIASCSSSSTPASFVAVSDGGASGEGAPPAPGYRPALTPEQCPLAPTGMALAKPAPFWYGLVTASFAVGGGVPDTVQIQTFDPSRQTWIDYPNGYYNHPSVAQTADGKYVVYVSPAVSDGNKDEMFKLRVRTTLQGCPPSAWTESEPFGLTDPFSGSTWVGTFPQGALNAAISANTTGGWLGVGPYTVAESVPATHSITFNADKTTTETVKYTISSPHPDDVYSGCSIVLNYTGTWTLDLTSGLRVSQRKPKAPGAAGSTCTTPPVADFAIEQVQVTPLTLSTLVITPSFGIDYTPSLETPPRKATMFAYQFANVLQQTLPHLAASEAGKTAQLLGSLNSNQEVYTKQ